MLGRVRGRLLQASPGCRSARFLAGLRPGDPRRKLAQLRPRLPVGGPQQVHAGEPGHYLGFRVARVQSGQSRANPEKVQLVRSIVEKPALPDESKAKKAEARKQEAGADSTVRPKQVTSLTGMKLVLIPAGEFLMGSPDSDKDAPNDEKPQHRVRITRPFYLGVYRGDAGSIPGGHRREPERVQRVGRPAGGEGLEGRCHRVLQQAERAGGTEAVLPVRRGSAVGRDGYRLPTEAEWEYACRAGSTTRFSFGDDAASLGEYAWFGELGQQDPSGGSEAAECLGPP